MIGALITHKGAEDIASAEVEEILNVKSRRGKGIVLFEADREGLCELCYKSQSAIKVFELLLESAASTMQQMKDAVRNCNLRFIKESFCVRCYESETFHKLDTEREIGNVIKTATKAEVNLESPKFLLVMMEISGKIYFGIDYSGKDISKRDYKIFNHPASLRGSVAYALLRFSGFDKGVLVDPFCGSGTIPIEAAIFCRRISPRKFERNFAFQNFVDYEYSPKKTPPKLLSKSKIYAFDSKHSSIASSEKNAKIAEVNKNIAFSRTEINWLDVKLNEKSVDYIVTNPPAPSRRNDEKNIMKLYEELFHQAKFVLKNKGSVGVITKHKNLFIDAADKSGFSADAINKIMIGNEERIMIRFKKKL